MRTLLNIIQKAMRTFLESIRKVWNSFVRFLMRLLFGIREEESSRPPETQVAEPTKPLAIEKEVAIPSELGISSADVPKYKMSKSLLSPSEQILYKALLRANNDEFKICPKVRMGDFVFLANEPQDRKFHVNQVLCKHVDFLFCRKFSLEPLLVVELDDSSHKQYVQSERDEFKNRTFHAIGLPYLRIALQQEYDWKSLQTQIKEKLKQKMN